ncbi:zinc finger protein 436-like isoform X2 [Pleurodeles waltl]|uniref:zinc finger protein 436-like isoform X2 n=1 Tax=Pleurodeles waltl TaxID=8319 RepID=UPI0037096F39
MRSRREMSPQGPAEVPFTFYDVAACFSEEEWKLLHQWQKELYRNVMQDIHQAFSSLGPLIATSIFSLRPKEKDDLLSMEHQDLEIRSSVTTCSRTMAAEPKALFSGNQYPKDAEEMDEAGSSDGPSIGCQVAAPGSVLKKEKEVSNTPMDHSDTEGGDLRPSPSLGPEAAGSVASIGINEEGETYTIDIQGYQRRDQFNRPTGNRSMNRKRIAGNSLKYSGRSTFCRPTARSLRGSMAKNMSQYPNPTHLVWSGREEELRGEETLQSQGDCSQQTHSGAHQVTPDAPRPETYSISESAIRNYNIIQCEPNLAQSSRQYIPPATKQTSQKKSHPRHQRTHEVKRRYACSECGKSFSAMSNLVTHERIHTGERPFHCTICGKSFNQTGVLHRHQKMHTGERPYQCNSCGKKFNQKHHLLGHQKIHKKSASSQSD